MNLAEDEKKKAAVEAITYIKHDSIVGIGTGSTVNYFVKELGKIKDKIDCAVASSVATTELLHDEGIRVIELNSSGDLDIYIDGADEADNRKHLIKGGGGALTREKIIANSSRTFICIVDETKMVQTLGSFPVAVEVIPMARSFVARQIVKLGGSPEWREGFRTDNDNWILDVYNLDLLNSIEMERKLNDIPGVVTNGIFAQRPPDKIIVGRKKGIEII